MASEALKIQQDEGRLAELGYKQELRRDWGMLHNFGVSFSIIVSTFLIITYISFSMSFSLSSFGGFI